jgi:hypothetical protein
MKPRDALMASPMTVGLPWPVDHSGIDRWGTELLGVCLTILPLLDHED